MFDFKDKVIWLTGASKGIGAALATELYRRGAKVAATARSAEALTEIEKQFSPRAKAFPGDVTDLSAMKKIAEEIESSLGPIDMIIANAGSCFYIQEDSFSSTECLSLMQLNYGGVLNCIDVTLPQMLKRKAGHIVGIASLAGYRALPRAGAYAATKAALINMLESLRFQLKRRGISVTVVNPGFVETPLTAKNKFPMPSLIDAETAARYICDGLENGRKEIYFPRPFGLFMKFMRIIPYPIYERLIAYMWKRLAYV